MSESMVERVARAIGVPEKEGYLCDWSLRAARAAIEAMREPNIDMLDSACAAWTKLYPAFEGEKPQPTAGEVVKTTFNAAIDTALSGK